MDMQRMSQPAPKPVHTSPSIPHCLARPGASESSQLLMIPLLLRLTVLLAAAAVVAAAATAPSLATRPSTFSFNATSCNLTLALPLPHHPQQPLPPITCDGCNFGSEPGWWDPARGLPAGSRWNVFHPACQPINLLAANKHAGRSPPVCPEAATTRPKMLLLLGDSVDRGLLEAVSQHWEVHLGKCGRIRILTSACGQFIFSTIHLYGSSPVGPWHLNITEPYTDILMAALHDWRQTLRLPDPDLVVINSNMWDITRAFQLSLLNQSSWFQQAVLPRDFLDSWTTNTTLMLTHIQQLFPAAQFGWHTVAAGAYKHDGTTQHLTHGRHSFVVQLNAAGRALAAAAGLVLLDYEAMVLGFPNFSYLQDLHHPNKDVQLEAANLYLNLLQQLPRVPSVSRACTGPAA